MIGYYIIEENHRDNCIKHIRSLPLNQYFVDIKEIGKTNQQRDYWHKIVRILADDAGYPEHVMKHMLKKACGLVETVVDRKGNTHEIAKSSENQSKKKYSELIDKTFEWANMINCRLPLAQELGMNF